MERGLGAVRTSKAQAVVGTLGCAFALMFGTLSLRPPSAGAVGGVSPDRLNEIPITIRGDAGDAAPRRLAIAFRQNEVRGFYALDDETFTFPIATGYTLQTIDARTGSRVRETLVSSPVLALHAHGLGPVALLENGNLLSKSRTHIAAFPQVSSIAMAGRAKAVRAASTSAELGGGDVVYSFDRTLVWIDREGTIRQQEALPAAAPSSPIVRMIYSRPGILALTDAGDLYVWKREALGFRSPPALIVNVRRWQSIGVDPTHPEDPLLGVTTNAIERFRFADRTTKEIAKAPSGFQFVSEAVVGPERQLMVGVRNANGVAMARFRNVVESDPSPAEIVLFGNVGNDGGTPPEPRIAESGLGVFVALDAGDLRFVPWNQGGPLSLAGPLCKAEGPSYAYGRYGPRGAAPTAPELVQITAHGRSLVALCLSSTLQLGFVGVRLM